MGSYWSYPTEPEESPAAQSSPEEPGSANGTKRTHEKDVTSTGDAEDSLLHTPRKCVM